METERLKQSLATNYLRLRELASGPLTARVPSCPEWTLADLISHVAHVYLHKVETMRRNSRPDPWPPPPTGETEVELLERGYRELEAEFAARPVTEKTVTWYGPDQTVGFWLRRMVHETVVHRWDAELAAGIKPGAEGDSLPVDDDVAFDGIDELLNIFVAWPSREWIEEFAEPLSAGPGSVAVVAIAAEPAPARRWLVSWDAKAIDVVAGDGPAAAEISGTPEAVLRWLWRRADSGVTVEGDPGGGDNAQVAQMRQILRVATQ